MASALRDLEFALNSGPHSAADIRPNLLRLSASLREWLEDREFASIDHVRESAKLIARLKSSALASIRFEIFCQSVPYLYAHGSLVDALAAALGMREASNSKPEVRRAENYLGIIQEGLGNVAQAVVHYHTALQLARELDDRAGEVSVLVNLGAAFCNGGLFRESMACFETAERITIPDPAVHRKYEKVILGNKSTLLLHTGDVKAAYAAMVRCISIAGVPQDTHGAYAQSNREFTFMQVALELGDLREAKAHVEACRKSASLSGSGMAAFNAKFVEGLYMVYAGQVKSGLALLKDAQVRSESLQLVNHRADALTMLVRAYQACERPHDALIAMRQLLDHISARRQAAVNALLSLDVPEDEIADQSVDLQTLKLREAELRAATAKMEAVDSTFEMLERLAITASLREDPSGHHGDRVARLSSLLAAKIGRPKGECFAIETAARLHDIGKVAIPDNILLTSEQLREEERRFLRNHTTLGAELLSKSSLPQLRLVEHVARYHHEWWDGSGYPTGIGGERIPVAARIVALADVFDALTHGRPYADAWPVQKALAEIERLAGAQFDPLLARSFVELVRDLEARHGSVDAFLQRSCTDTPFARARRNIARIVASH